MVGVIDGFRWCILGQQVHIPTLVTSLSVAFILFIFGMRYFRKTEKTFADII
jgi:lipopolysaccharide transport system permease protein